MFSFFHLIFSFCDFTSSTRLTTAPINLPLSACERRSPASGLSQRERNYFFSIKYKILGADVLARLSRFRHFKPRVNADMNPHCGADIYHKKRSCFAFFALFAVMPKSAFICGFRFFTPPSSRYAGEWA